MPNVTIQGQSEYTFSLEKPLKLDFGNQTPDVFHIVAVSVM